MGLDPQTFTLDPNSTFFFLKYKEDLTCVFKHVQPSLDGVLHISFHSAKMAFR